jgi:hypothetical protein
LIGYGNIALLSFFLGKRPAATSLAVLSRQHQQTFSHPTKIISLIL